MPQCCTGERPEGRTHRDVVGGARGSHDGIVSYENHYLFAATGADLVSAARLRFRTRAELRQSRSTKRASRSSDVYGAWARGPVGPRTAS